MKWAAELACLSLVIESRGEGDGVWVLLNDGLEGGLGLIDALVVCLSELAELGVILVRHR